MLEVNGHTKVAVEHGVLVVESYKNDDPEVVRAFADLQTPEAKVKMDSSLSLGVRVAQIASPVLDAAYVHREFESNLDRQKQVLVASGEAVKTELMSVLLPVISDDGALIKSITRVETGILTEVRKYCDEESAKSIAATVAKKLAEHSRQIEDHLRGTERRVEMTLSLAFDVTEESRGLGKLFKFFRTNAEQTQDKLAEIMAKISGLVERRDERQGSTRKGEDFQSGALAELAQIAAIHGDAADDTSSQSGEVGRRKRGDAVITVNPALVKGHEIRIVVEAADRSSGSKKQLLRELDEAKENRAAVGAIAILSMVAAPGACKQRLQQCGGNRYICVLDNEAWDTLPLQLAYLWARTEAVRAIDCGKANETEIAKAAQLIEDALGFLGNLDRARAKFSAIRSATTDGEGVLSEIEGKITRCLSKAAQILEGVGGG